MGWKAYHRRGEVLRHVIATADRRRDGLLPLDVPGVEDRFVDELDLLSALLLRWHSRLSAHLERQLSQQPMDLEGAAMDGWRQTAEELPGIRAILDWYSEHPVDARMADALAKSSRKEKLMLATMVGRVASPSAALPV